MTREEMWKEFEYQLIRETRTPITMSFDTAERMTRLGIKETVYKWKDRLELALIQQRWIPCSERMPEERGVYIVTEKVYSINDRKHTGCFNLMTEQVEFSNGKWIRASFYEVIAWMPLPEPYKEEREV